MSRKKRKNKSKSLFGSLAFALVAGLGTLGYSVAKDVPLNEMLGGKEAPASQSSSSVRPKPLGGASASSKSVEGSSASPKPAGGARLLELPATRKGEVIVRHSAYTLSYNTQHNNPNWVAWELTSTEVEGTGRRSNDFQPDPLLDARYRVTTDDYKGSGYDRGHMCPAADNKFDAHAMTECFYMSNMCPQLHELNAGAWEKLESKCRSWAKQEGSVLIVCGPLYDSQLKSRQGEASTRKQLTIGREHQVSVPSGFFKCVMSLRPDHEKAIAFVYSQTVAKQPMQQVCTSVDEVEALTGYDFFVNVPSKLEKRIEATFSLKAWK